MLNKTIGLGIFFIAATAAWGQNVTYTFVLWESNPEIERLNGMLKGDQLPSTLLIPPGSGTLRVALRVTNHTETAARYGAGGLMLCFDAATTGNTNYASQAAAIEAGIHKKLNISNFLYAGEAGSDLGPVAKVDNLGNAAGSGGITALSKNYSGAYTPMPTGLKPIGLWTAFNFGTGLNLSLPAGGSALLASMTIDLRNLVEHETFGDSGYETGLMIYGRNNAPSRHTYLGATSGPAQQQSPKIYKIQVVPEPVTALALGGALVAFARRKLR